MKVMLLRPWGVADEVIPPMGLGYLAGALRPAHDVRIIDGLKDGLTPDKIDPVLEWRPDIVGLPLFSKEIRVARLYLERIKRILPSCVTVVGGPHPSFSPESVFETCFPEHLDYAFAGEAEIGLPRLLAALDGDAPDLSSVPGLIWRADGKVRCNPRVCHEPLDDFACAWDLMPPDRYPCLPHGAFYRRFPVAPIIVTRGCPFSCVFCSAHLISGKRTRSRSLENVLEEVRRLAEEHGVKEIHIEDDNFTADRAFVRAFSRALIDRRWELSWTCPNGVRLDTLDEETLRVMKESGCYILSVGVESGSDRVLRLMKKNLTTARIREKVELIHRTGIKVSGFFLIGFPGETAAELEETFRFSRELPLIRATYSYFQPYPSSENALELPPVDVLHDDFNLHRINFVPEGLTSDAMHRMRQRALLRFYLRPRVLADFIGGIRSYDHLKGVARRSWRWLRA